MSVQDNARPGKYLRRADFFNRMEFPENFLKHLHADHEDWLEIRPTDGGWIIRKDASAS